MRLMENDMQHIIFVSNDDSLDWQGIGAPQITQRVLTKVKPGSIILFHNAAKHTPEALPGIIDSLQQQGYKIVPVSQLIFKDNYTIDVAGKQHSNAASTAWMSDDIKPVQPEYEPE
jgi:Predicted xylanase/chitin deacetylase